VRPTLAELVGRIRSDIRGRLSIAGPLVRRAMADVLGAVFAGAVHGLHGHLVWISRQIFATTAEREGLLRQASLYSIFPTPASFATGNVTATGTNGSTVPTNRILVLQEGVTYRVTADATITGGVATVPVIAVLAGSAANADAGATLSFESPIPSVDSIVTVQAGGIAGGFDQQGTEEVRDRLILRLREPPEGGAERDYIAWALAVAGVTRVFVYPNENGLGTVVVRFVLDGEVYNFPDVGTVAAVQAALEAQRPITATVTAEAPTPLEVDFALQIDPDTAATRAAVQAELADMLFREAEPGDGAGRGTIKLSHVQVAVGVAEGVEDFTILAPVADVVPAAGELAIVGEVDFS
jgi:uncharacterized phage protein gp47/JayE